MIDIKSMGYIRVESTDLEAWKTFNGKVLGLMEGRGPNPENQYWRIDELSDAKPDAIVFELGDGLLGAYGV